MFQIPQVVLEFIANGGLPIKHASYSALKEFAKNERSFEMKYIRYEFTKDTSPSAMIWSAVHKALEERTIKLREWEILSPGEIKTIADNYFNRLVYEQKIKAIGVFFAQNSREYPIPEFMKDMTNDEVYAEYQNVREIMLEEFKEANLEEVENSLIKWWKPPRTITPQECIMQIDTAISNFLEYDGKREYTPLYAELEQLVSMNDGDAIIPLPLKVIIDRIDEVWEDIEVIDYKTVSKFSDLESVKWDYELQAGSNYYAVSAVVRAPKRIRFIEILKEEWKYRLPSDPNRRLLQADLRQLLDESGITWEKYDKNADLEQKLIYAGILEKEPSVQEYVIDFSESSHILDMFQTFFKVVITRLALSQMFEIPSLPNVTDQYTGGESYLDFINALTGNTVSRRKTADEDYQGF